MFLTCMQVLRLEGQVKRYKASAEQAEAQEEELKAERRKLTREVRYQALTICNYISCNFPALSDSV